MQKNLVLKLIPFFGFMPICFSFFSIFQSRLISLDIPLILVILLFLGLIIFSLLKKKILLGLGVLMIMPLFISACLAFSNYNYFFQRTIIAGFAKNLSPSADFLLGTDYVGRDLLSTLIIGGMNIYTVAVISTLITLLAGIPSGIFLTARNSIIRAGASIITEFFEIIPQLFFVLIVLGVYNFWAAANTGSRLIIGYALPLAGFAIGISSLPSIARVLEARINLVKTRRFISAFQSSNVSHSRILFYNILWKNCISEIIIQSTFLFGSTILIESALGYVFEIGFGELGTGGYLSWGKILAEARRSLLFGENLRVVVYPVMMTIMSILGINIIGDRLVKFLNSEL